MTPDDDLTPIEADDTLLSAIAAGADADAGDDAAGSLLVDIVRSVDGLTQHGAPGGSGRNGHRRRGGLWGLSLGVSIAVVAGGGLSAAATDRLPEPVQRFVTKVGQVVPAAEATPPVAPPNAAAAPGSAGRSRTATRSESAAQFPYAGHDGDRDRSWSQAGDAQSAPPWPRAVGGTDAAAVPTVRYSSAGHAPAPYPYSYPWSVPFSPAPYAAPTPSTSYTAPASSYPTSAPTPTPTSSPTTTPTATPAPSGYPARTAAPSPTPTTAPQPKHGGHGNPSQAPAARQHTTAPTQPAHGSAHSGARRPQP